MAFSASAAEDMIHLFKKLIILSAPKSFHHVLAGLAVERQNSGAYPGSFHS